MGPPTVRPRSYNIWGERTRQRSPKRISERTDDRNTRSGPRFHTQLSNIDSQRHGWFQSTDEAGRRNGAPPLFVRSSLAHNASRGFSGNPVPRMQKLKQPHARNGISVRLDKNPARRMQRSMRGAVLLVKATPACSYPLQEKGPDAVAPGPSFVSRRAFFSLSPS